MYHVVSSLYSVRQMQYWPSINSSLSYPSLTDWLAIDDSIPPTWVST
jgi:hypothetical protein